MRTIVTEPNSKNDNGYTDFRCFPFAGSLLFGVADDNRILLVDRTVDHYAVQGNTTRQLAMVTHATPVFEDGILVRLLRDETKNDPRALVVLTGWEDKNPFDNCAYQIFEEDKKKLVNHVGTKIIAILRPGEEIRAWAEWATGNGKHSFDLVKLVYTGIPGQELLYGLRDRVDKLVAPLKQKIKEVVRQSAFECMEEGDEIEMTITEVGAAYEGEFTGTIIHEITFVSEETGIKGYMEYPDTHNWKKRYPGEGDRHFLRVTAKGEHETLVYVTWAEEKQQQRPVKPASTRRR